MELYKKDGSVIRFNDSMLIGSGSQGDVYRDCDRCLKLYRVGPVEIGDLFSRPNMMIKPEIYNYFKELDSNSFVKLYDLIYDKDLESVCGYTMDYCQKTDKSILDLPVDYLVENYDMISNAFDKLTLDRVRVTDLYSDNMINTDNGIVIIDYDSYYFEQKNSNDEIYLLNRLALKNGFYSLLKETIDLDEELKGNNFSKKLDYLFTPETRGFSLKCKVKGKRLVRDIFVK